MIRRFHLLRHEDASGVSGTGHVAEGVEFSGGKTVLHWLRAVSSLVIYDSADELVAVHGHGGLTELIYDD